MDDILVSTPIREAGKGRPRSSIKWLSCIVRPEKLEVLKEKLGALNLIGGITISDVRGFGRQKGSTEHYKGVPYVIRLINKVKVDLVISSDDVAEVIGLIRNIAFSGEVGDGKIFVMQVTHAQRIRTGEKGVDAL